MNHVYISSFQQNNMISGVYRVNNLQNKTAKNGMPYLSAMISDATGRMNMICWNSNCSPNEQSAEFIRVAGAVGYYNGGLQLIAENYCFPTQKESENIDVSMLVPTVPINVRRYVMCLNDAIRSITDQSLSNICQYIFDSYWDEIITIPAAKLILILNKTL